MYNQSDGPHAGGLGKIPSYGDFIRHRATGPSWQSFDAWVQRGLFALKHRGRGRHKQEYPGAPAFCFMHGTETHVLVGVMQPSKDSVGRAFPLIIGVDVPCPDMDLEAAARLPMRWAGFLDRAATLAATATDGTLDATEVMTRLDELEAVADARANAEWDRYLHRTSVQDFLRAATGEDGEAAQRYMLNGLATVVAPYRDHPDLTPRFGLRLPLNGSDAELSYQIVFWLTTVFRMGGIPLRETTICWTVDREASEVALLTFFGLSAEQAFPHLFPGASEDDYVLYLAGGSVDGASGQQSFYDALLQHNPPTLYHVLEQL